MRIDTIPQFRKEFKELVKKYRSLPQDVQMLIDELADNPFTGTPIGRRCYKIRLKIASKNTGKSGGARVITHVFVENDVVTLLPIYDKSEQADIDDEDILKRLKNLNTQ